MSGDGADDEALLTRLRDLAPRREDALRPLVERAPAHQHLREAAVLLHRQPVDVLVITSYSIHYTKLYDLRLKWISASEGAAFAEEVRLFVELLKELGGINIEN